MNMDPNAFDRERKPPGLPKKVPPPKVPKRTGSSLHAAQAVFPRTVFEAVAQPSTSLSGPRVRDRDREVIYNWLRQILFHEYTDCFLDAGYDLPTIARMTPVDLAAIGIRQPAHRRFLKQHIDALVLPDALPRHVPATIEKWLRLLRLDEYLPALLEQGFRTVQDVTVLTWEDLEELGIVRLGHQKRLLLAIERIKDITSGRLASYTVSEEVAEPQPIEYVTISWRSVASVTHQLPPPDGPYNACTSFRSAPTPKGSYALLADLGGPKAEEPSSSSAEEPTSSSAEELASSKAEEPAWSWAEEPASLVAEEAASSNAEEPAPFSAEEEDTAFGTRDVQGAVAAPTPEEMYDSSVLDNVEQMLATLIAELDTLYGQQMDE
uniref:SAM domain-containing protein n=1 Tax=Anopheles atroparvus TaxID=41427 RepID=A0A182JF16_ANOAO